MESHAQNTTFLLLPTMVTEDAMHLSFQAKTNRTSRVVQADLHSRIENFENFLSLFEGRWMMMLSPSIFFVSAASVFEHHLRMHSCNDVLKIVSGLESWILTDKGLKIVCGS